MSLEMDEIRRYSRQINLDQLGLEGQLLLKNAKILCIGSGGLGSSVLFYLAAAGVGTLGIVDNDVVELGNLHRQILYHTSSLGKQKSHLAQQQLNQLNPHININACAERLDTQNANELISQYDIIADCSDNFATHYLINDVCFALDKPCVFASVSQFEGHCSVFPGNRHPCFRCVFPTVPTALPDRSAGVIGVVPGLLGIIQATEIIKLILKSAHSLCGELLRVDLLKMQFRKFHLTQNPECPKHSNSKTHKYDCLWPIAKGYYTQP